MNEVTGDSVSERLEQMERRVIRLRRGFVVSLVALVGLAAMSGVREAQASAAGRTQTPLTQYLLANAKARMFRDFVVEDEPGSLRAAFGHATDGSPVLGFLDRNGNVRVTIGLNADGSPALYFFSSR